MFLKAEALEPIPLYGDGANVCDWLYVEEHVDSLLLAATQGQVGSSYCVGTMGKALTGRWWWRSAPCWMNGYRPTPPHAEQITPVTYRPGHDRRYAIDPTRIRTELGWQHRDTFEEGLAATVDLHLDHLRWRQTARERSKQERAIEQC